VFEYSSSVYRQQLRAQHTAANTMQQGPPQQAGMFPQGPPQQQQQQPQVQQQIPSQAYSNMPPQGV
jgi:hypothetical protein